MYIENFGYCGPFSAIIDLFSSNDVVAANALRAYCRDVLQVDVDGLDDNALELFNYVNPLSPALPMLRSMGAATVLQPLVAARDVGVFDAEFTLDGHTRRVYFVALEATIAATLASFQVYIDEGFINNVQLSGRADMQRHKVYSNFAEVFCELTPDAEQAIESVAWLSLTDNVIYALDETVAGTLLALFLAE